MRIQIPSLLVGASSLRGTIQLVGASAKLSPTPPMGFNNWSRFECNLNETLFTTTADAMRANGLCAAGYNRLNLDDCWMTHERAANGSLEWDPVKFPHGIPWLRDYVHERGFHLGIYEDAGTLTCGGYPGTLGYEEIDARTFASWGIDYLKLDGCNMPTISGLTAEETYQSVYGKWHEILSALPHPLIFSESAPAYFTDESQATLSDWYRVMGWVPAYGELARHSTDILVYRLATHTWDSILNNYGYEVRLARYQRPGYFNDPDFIVPDWPDLNLDEKRTHFALWASFSAPLIISAYVPDLTADELAYLTNEDLIAVDQDPLALQATLVSQDGRWDVLSKSLANGDRLLTVLNRGNGSGSYSLSTDRLGLVAGSACSYSAKDLWTGSTTTVAGQMHVRDVPKHGTAVFRISSLSESEECDAVTPTGMIFNTASLLCVADPAAASGSAGSKTCDGTDGQVWQVSDDGTIHSLASRKYCLTETRNGHVVSIPCGRESRSQQWRYELSGNVINVASGNCLTEGGNATLISSKCLDEADSQVFGLPSGVTVH